MLSRNPMEIVVLMLRFITASGTPQDKDNLAYRTEISLLSLRSQS